MGRAVFHEDTVPQQSRNRIAVHPPTELFACSDKHEMVGLLARQHGGTESRHGDLKCIAEFLMESLKRCKDMSLPNQCA